MRSLKFFRLTAVLFFLVFFLREGNIYAEDNSVFLCSPFNIRDRFFYPQVSETTFLNDNPVFFADAIFSKSFEPDIFEELNLNSQSEDVLLMYEETDLKDTKAYSFRMKEMFTDFSFGENPFFRVEARTIKWGVSYFFSPAEAISLGVISPEKSERRMDGPVSLKSKFIFPKSDSSMQLYLIVPDETEQNALSFAVETAVAGKFSFVLTNSEIGIGGWYKYARPLKFLTTLAFMPFRNLGVYGEIIYSWGTEEEWLEFNWFTEKTLTLQGTAGLSYWWKTPNIIFSMQYYYNGFGSDLPSALEASEFLFKQRYYNYVGKHYYAFSVNKEDLLTDRLSASIYTIMSASEFSGMLRASVCCNVFKTISVSLGPFYVFGEKETEFMQRYEADEQRLGLALSVKM